MIKAVFFDLFNTLVRFDPTPEEHQQRVCRQFGIEVGIKELRRGFCAAGDFYSTEDARHPMIERSIEEQEEMWINYEMIYLGEAGVTVSRETASAVFHTYRQMERSVVLFDDSLPTLDVLRRQGLTVGIISNLDQSVDEFCNPVRLTQSTDFALTSHEVGYAKPDPQIFSVALANANVTAAEAIHVGDQYYADIVGARKTGIKPLLIDRDGLLDYHTDCERIGGLGEIFDHL